MKSSKFTKGRHVVYVPARSENKHGIFDIHGYILRYVPCHF